MRIRRPVTEAGAKKIIAIAAGVVLIAGLGIGAFALSSHKTANTQPAEQEQTVTPVKDNSEEKDGQSVDFRYRQAMLDAQAGRCRSVDRF